MTKRFLVRSESGAKVAVRHKTVFHYATPVKDSANTLHLEPRTFPYQKTLSAFIRVVPTVRLSRFVDLYQNITHHFELAQPHTKLAIESLIKVHNLPLDIDSKALVATAKDYDDNATLERTWLFLQESKWVSKHPNIWKQALEVASHSDAIYEQACAIMAWIHQNFTYAPGSTSVNTHLEQAFAQRSGVCQDFTHVMLGMCRSLDIPARYASGYLYNGPRDSLVGSQASHAWCEVYLPGAGWIGFDPTNNNLADERYVKIAVGRDYEDVAPVRGTYYGTAHCKLEVSVIVEKLQ